MPKVNRGGDRRRKVKIGLNFKLDLQENQLTWIFGTPCIALNRNQAKVTMQKDIQSVNISLEFISH